jgi:hypothetical protein
MKRPIAHLLLIVVAAFVLCAFQRRETIVPSRPITSLISHPGWQWVQDTYAISSVGCTNRTTCTISASPGGFNGALPMTAGTLRVLYVLSDDGNSGSHVASAYDCSASSCNSSNATDTFTCGTPIHNSGNDDVSICWVANGSGTPNTYTFSTSAGCGTSYCAAYLMELLPPSGYTASLDVGPTANISTGCAPCTGVSLTPSATDACFQIADWGDGQSIPEWNGSGYISDQSGIAAFLLNTGQTTISAPSFTQGSSNYFSNFGLCFKSSAGIFAGPATPFSMVQVQIANTGTTCNSTCTLSIDPTKAGDLLFLFAGTESSSVLSSVTSGSDTFTVPSGLSSCAKSASSGGQTIGLSCAYVLSSHSGDTSLTITMSTNATPGFWFMEVSRLRGSWTLDTQGQTLGALDARIPTTGTNPASYLPSGVALTLRGNNDAIFAEFADSGGACGSTLLPWIFPQYVLNPDVSGFALLNSMNASAETYCNPQDNTTFGTKIAFK